jgi:integrase
LTPSKEALDIASRAHQSSPGPWLFYAPDTHGNQPGKFRKLRIWTALRQVLKAVNIDHGTVHTFRHCFCAYLANNCPQVTPFQVMKFMGHSSLDIVMTYFHAGPQDLVSAMATVDFSKMTSAESKGTSEVSANNVKGGADATKITS